MNKNEIIIKYIIQDILHQTPDNKHQTPNTFHRQSFLTEHLT